MKIIGVIGGMGPLATIDLLNKIVKNTDAKKDSEHVRMMIDSNSQIPDRTDYILGKGKNPVEEMVKSGKILKSMGVDYLIMPCNTAHYFAEEVCKQVGLDIINMVEETANYVENDERIGILGTKGVYISGIYRKVFERKGIEVVEPDNEIKELINEVIYLKKAGIQIEDEILTKIENHFLEKGCESLLLGCTELPIVFRGFKSTLKTIDPTTVLARKTIEYSGKRLCKISHSKGI